MQEKDCPLKKTLSKVPSKRAAFCPATNRPPLKPCPPVHAGVVADKSNRRPITSSKLVADDQICSSAQQLEELASPRRVGSKKSIRDRLRGSVQDSRDEIYFT